MQVADKKKARLFIFLGHKVFTTTSYNQIVSAKLQLKKKKKKREVFKQKKGLKKNFLVKKNGVNFLFMVCSTFVAMIIVECTDVGISVISKAALTKGMSNIVSVVYYNGLATLILLHYFIFCRSSGQIVYLTGVKYSSATLSSALMNLIPIFTFLLAVILRMEKLELRRSSSQAKASGTVVAVTGAFVVTLYKGPPVLMPPSPSNSPQHLLLSEKSRWIIGSFLIVLVCLSSATWNVVLAATVKEYPDKMTIVFFFTFFITIHSLVFSLILERNPTAWKVKSSVEVAAIVYTAIFGSLFHIAIHTWCLQKKGPVYVVMFKPLGIVVAVVLTFIFLGDTLYLGRYVVICLKS
ncbi:hypothetical protein REPUB_Repub10bG0039800 [Reevesia pubescens]